jgi:hypothetical protein
MRNVRSKTILPWLFPLTLVLAVLVVAFAPSVVTGVLGVVVFILLGCGRGVPLWHRLRHDRGDGSGASQ